LKGDGYQAEQILEDLLRRNVRDLDARLLLATLLRRAGRVDDATRQLDTLACFEGADKWNWRFKKSVICWPRQKRKSVGRVSRCVLARTSRL